MSVQNHLIMSSKFLSLLLVFVIVFSCKKNQDTLEVVSDKPTDSLTIKKKDIAKIRYTDYILDTRTEDALVVWDAYTQLQTLIDNLKKADLTAFRNNKKEIKELLLNLKQNIPMEVNSPSILSRITALETKILKFESLVNLSTTGKKELLKNIEDILIAFSNLKLQMNKKIESDNIIIERPGGEITNGNLDLESELEALEIN